MSYVVRFVQTYLPGQRADFMELEARFASLEQRRSDFPKGRRSQPYVGREPSNTLVWECEFPTLAAAQAALEKIKGDEEHEALFREQSRYTTKVYTEIDEILEL